MARKLPSRPNNSISQQYNDGELTVFSVFNGAAPGDTPKALLKPKGKLRYEEQRVGLIRDNFAKQRGVEITQVLRCPWIDEVSPQDVVIPIDGEAYQIDQKQLAKNVWPKSMDLSLYRFTENYEVNAL